MKKPELIKMLKNLIYTGRVAGMEGDKLSEFEKNISDMIYEKGGDKNAG